MSEENKYLIRRFFEEIDKGNLEALDEFVSPDYNNHSPALPELPPGLDGLKQAFGIALSAFSDFYHTIEDQIAEGDLVVTRLSAWGTHTGELLGIPPTNKRLNQTGITIHRIADGKIVEHWANRDDLGMMQQLGAIPDQGQVQE